MMRSKFSPSARTRYCCGPASRGNGVTTEQKPPAEPKEFPRLTETRWPTLNLVCAMKCPFLERSATERRCLSGYLGAQGSKGKRRPHSEPPKPRSNRLRQCFQLPSRLRPTRLEAHLFVLLLGL